LYDSQGGSESDWNITGSCVKVKGKKKCSARDIVSSDFPYICFFPPHLKAGAWGSVVVKAPRY
jgi:hypothetical protein